LSISSGILTMSIYSYVLVVVTYNSVLIIIAYNCVFADIVCCSAIVVIWSSYINIRGDIYPRHNIVVTVTLMQL
jgi:hypothetical protein